MDAMDKKPVYMNGSLLRLRYLRLIVASVFCCFFISVTGCDSNSGSGDIYSSDTATPFAEVGSVTCADYDDADGYVCSGTGVGRYLGKAVEITSYTLPILPGGSSVDPDYQQKSCTHEIVYGNPDDPDKVTGIKTVCDSWEDIEIPAGGTVYYFDQKYDPADTTITGPTCIFQYNTCLGDVPDEAGVCDDSGNPYPQSTDTDADGTTYADLGLPPVVLSTAMTSTPNANAGDWNEYNELGSFPGFRMYWRPSVSTGVGPLATHNKTDLFIFLNGGGTCYRDETHCTTDTNFGEITGINDPALIPGNELYTNPVKDWSYGFVPYCDGALFLGDEQYDNVNTDIDELGYTARIQQGLQNVSAALDVIKTQFYKANGQEPKRILLGGSSAGGFGTISAVVLVRLLWPDIPIYVMNDSGVGIAKWTHPQWIQDRLLEWAAMGVGDDNVIPASCPYCDANGNMTELLRWQLERDPDLHMGSYSSYEDFVIGTAFMGLLPSQFRSALVSETERIHEQFPKRFQYFHVNGRSHTVLYSQDSVKLPNVAVRWIQENLIAWFPSDGLSEEGLVAGYEDAHVGNTTVIQWLQGMLPADYVDGEPPLPDYDIWKSLGQDGGDSTLTTE